MNNTAAREIRTSGEASMRFEVCAALVIGVLLPALETLRRGISQWTIDFTTMFEDYVAGALLLIGAWAVQRHRHWGSVFLLVAWSYVTGMVSSSFWYQLEETVRGIVSEPPVVLIVKLLLWATCVAAVISAFRRILPAQRA
jgi:hypothetical protein